MTLSLLLPGVLFAGLYTVMPNDYLCPAFRKNGFSSFNPGFISSGR